MDTGDSPVGFHLTPERFRSAAGDHSQGVTQRSATVFISMKSLR
jgi:hypothetical protein